MEYISIKGISNPIRHVVRITKFGPILSDALWSDDDPKKNGDKALALRWVALERGDTTLESFFLLQKASNWMEFRDAIRPYVAPSQNFVFADKEGNIGYITTGKLIRRTDPISGFVYSLGNDTSDATLPPDYLDFEENPSVLNPKCGYIISANNKVTPPSFPYYLLNEHGWDLPYRAERIEEMVVDGLDGLLSVTDIQKIQTDVDDVTWRVMKGCLR